MKTTVQLITNVLACIVIVTTVLSASTVHAQQTPAPEPTDWVAAAHEDLQALHEIIKDGHPGPVDPKAPQFNPQMVQHMDAAKALIAKFSAQGSFGRAQYIKVLRRYTAAYDDGHVGLLFNLSTNGASVEWAGFMLRGMLLGDGNMQAIVNASELPGVTAGSQLHSCDGVDWQTLLKRDVTPYWGQASIPHGDAALVWRLAVTQVGDRAAQPASCRFVATDGRLGEPVALQWRTLDSKRFGELAQTTLPGWYLSGTRSAFTQIGPKVWRVSVPSFNMMNGNEATERKQAFDSALQAIQQRTWAADETLVIDVRGNTGGNSSYGARLAATVWGDTAATTASNRLDWTVDWRLSETNLARSRDYIDTMSRVSFKHGMGARMAMNVMQSAFDRGQTLYRMGTLKDKVDTTPVAHTQAARVVVLTDERCASACLDFMDLALMMRSVEHIGLPTSADSLYMESAVLAVPSNRVRLIYPVKVYRNRVRGHQVFYMPTARLNTVLLDDAALAAWITNGK